MQKHLEEQVTKIAGVVADWQRSIASIDQQISVAQTTLAEAEKHRRAHALNATLGDNVAIAEIKRARADANGAQNTLNDLALALPEAQAQLAEAEKAAASARHALTRLQAEKLMRQRVDVGGQLDTVSAEFARLYGEYERLGAQIENMDMMPRTMHGGTDHEGAVGARRVRASLPKFFWKLFPGAVHDEMKTENLATAEARFWGLAPVETATTKAA